MILITGANGNNGSELVKLLSQRGARIRGMTRKSGNSSIPGVEFVTADFDDRDSIRRVLEGIKQFFL